MIYPPSPHSFDRSIVEPSSAFKFAVVRTLLAIILFIVVYLLLFAGTVGLSAYLSYLAYTLLAKKIHWITILLCAAAVGFGLFLVFFLVKFLFKRDKADYSQLTEITESDHPKLYEFIRKLADECATPMPKRIFLSADVNASVFYDQSTLSMFLPVKKNLIIGLGLVNSMNLGELKSIVAHEFGHFSQRSMKLGSYVYNVNHVIFNLLYDNDTIEQLIERASAIHYFFGIAAYIALFVINIIKYILRAFTR